MIFFNEKKNQKDSDDFWHRKLTLKVKFWYFLTAPHYSNFQNLVISFEYSWFLAKNLSNFVSLPWKLHNRECHNVYFPMVYHTFIWNHVSWHSRVLNMTHFQLFAWFGKILLVKKNLEKSKFLLVHTIAPKTNSQWSSWVWTRSSWKNFRSI